MADTIAVQVNIDDHYKQCVLALQTIAQLADTGSKAHKARFCPDGEDGIPTGWRVAEAMREVANDVVGSVSLTKSLFAEYDRVKVRNGMGRDAGHYGTIIHVGGDDGTYYGVKLDCYENAVGYSEYELEQANLDEPAWLTRFAKGKADCSPFSAKEIADQIRQMLVYKRAMESMAKQFVHPKMTAREMAEMQLRSAT